MKNTKFYLLLTFLLLSIILALILRIPKENKPSLSLISNRLSSGSSVLILELFTTLNYLDSGFGNQIGVKKLIRDIDVATKDENIKGLILRVNSPGGTFGASEEFYQAMIRFGESGKPIVSSIIDLCASGAYYAVLPSNLILANRGAIVGSIGVRITSPDLTELYKKIGVGYNQIISVEYKDILSESRKMKPQEIAHLKKMVDSSHKIFVDDVIKWRENKSSATILNNAANGLIYSAGEAKKIGLIDELGGMHMAKIKMANLLKLNINRINFIYPEDDIFKKIFETINSEIKTMIKGIFFQNINLSQELK